MIKIEEAQRKKNIKSKEMEKRVKGVEGDNKKGWE